MGVGGIGGLYHLRVPPQGEDVGALADEGEFQLERQGVKVLRTEGHDGKRWVLLDYGSVIVHVFTQEAHDYYDLEHLWADATPVPASEWLEEKTETAE